FFVNTLVLRTDLSGNPTFQELLQRVRDVTLGAYEHQDAPFEKLIEELHPERNLSHSPLFQVMLVLQNEPRKICELNELIAERLDIDKRTAKFDLALSLHEEGDGLRGRLEYSTDVFEAATISRLMEHFQTLLQEIVTTPQQRIGDLHLMTEAERRQVLVEWNDTAVNRPRDQCVHELFEE